MSKKKPEKIILELRAHRASKVRYGRARLTIDRWGSFLEGDLGQAINRRREGKATDEEVAWAYVKDRVSAHTPSFKWGGADLNRLIVLVTEASKEPELKAKNAEELVPQLLKAQAEEREQLREARKKMQKSLRAVYPDFSQFTKGLSVINATGMQSALAALRKPLIQEARSAAIGPHISSSIVGPTIAGQLNTNYSSLMKAAMASAPSFEPRIINFDPTLKSGLSQLMEGLSLQGIVSKQLANVSPSPALADLYRMATETAEAARANEDREAAEVLEATAEAFEEAETEPDIEALVEGLKPLFDQVTAAIEKASQQPNAYLLMVAGVLLGLLVQFIAAKAGIPLSPTPKK